MNQIQELPYRHICIEGNIGSGKTTLVDMMSAEFNGQKILEEFSFDAFALNKNSHRLSL